MALSQAYLTWEKETEQRGIERGMNRPRTDGTADRSVHTAAAATIAGRVTQSVFWLINCQIGL